MSLSINGQANGHSFEGTQGIQQDSGSKTLPASKKKRVFESGPGEGQDQQELNSKKACLSPPTAPPIPLPPDTLDPDIDPVPQDSLVQDDAQDTPLHHPRPKRLPPPLNRGRAPASELSELDAFVSQWLETVGASRRPRSRSCHSDGSFDHLLDRNDVLSITKPEERPRRKPIEGRPRSAPPDMDKMDADGFAIPQTPRSQSVSSSSRSRRGSRGGRGAARSSTPTDRSETSPSRIKVEDPNYRIILGKNNIRMIPGRNPPPQHVTDFANTMRRTRDSPEPTLEELQNDAIFTKLYEGSTEEAVGEYFRNSIGDLSVASPPISRVLKAQMNRQVLPSPRNANTPMYSTPVPDALYGYDSEVAFTDREHVTYIEDNDSAVRATRDNNTLVFPFFAIEFKGANGNMWVAANQCLGGAATCVSLAEELNRQLLSYCQNRHNGDGGDVNVETIDSRAFSIAMNGNEARLYVSWKAEDLNYYMATVAGFFLWYPEQYLEFRRMVRNIIDWGKNERLESIRGCLDRIIEESRKQASRDAKARERSPESAASGSTSGKGKKQKT